MEPVDRPEYVATRLKQLLAEDPETSEQGIDVVLVSDQLFLRGVVATPERRDAVAAFVSRHAPGVKVHNELVTCDWPEPSEAESLS